jgi:hypothetical protein
MRLDSLPRNGDGYAMARSPGLAGLDPRRQEFLLEGSIDPANKRARHRPLQAPPNSYAEGSEGFYYQLPASTRKFTNNVDLMKKARESYSSRLGLLQPPADPVSVKNPGFDDLLKKQVPVV